MTSTIHIFDEYPELTENLPESKRHKKRMELERLIFSTLKTRYGTALQKAWASWNPPSNTQKKILILERRIHENLEFLLHNCAWAGQEGAWGLCVVCSDVNETYVRTLVGEKNVQVLPLFKGNPSPEQGKQEYNELLQTSEFYEYFDEEFLWLVEMDCYFRKQIPDSVMTCDYIAAPYAWDPSGAGGGLSFRRRSIMMEICNLFPIPLPAQDVYACHGIRAIGGSMPPLLYSKDILAESILDGDPVGVHQWWTFFSPKLEGAEDIFQRFMTLELW
jgi:hypothetical protein